jgi:hydroxymethylbilane synthase
VRTLRIGTRGSVLAMWQAGFVRDALKRLAGAECELVIVKTSGDRLATASLAKIGGKGVFIKELEDALLEKRLDLAVHSMKDVPTEIPAGLSFPAICAREDVRDCLISRGGASLPELPRGARVGTGSLRRQAQLRHARPELDFRDLRGNVDTRLRKLEAGDYDAIVLAKAGLDRLGWSERITEVLSADVCLPAAGQGALGIEARTDDAEVREIVARLDDAPSRVGVTAERSVLAALGGGCQVPFGAWGRIEGAELVLEACVLSVDGAEYLHQRATGDAARPEELGRALAAELLAAGAGEILKRAEQDIARR